jgi:hypothetical protein
LLLLLPAAVKHDKLSMAKERGALSDPDGHEIQEHTQLSTVVRQLLFFNLFIFAIYYL